MGRGCREHALAVAHHPNLTADAAEDDDRCCQTVLRVLLQAGHHRLLIMLSDTAGHTTQKFLARRGFGHTTNMTADELHGISSVRAEKTVMIVRFRGAAIDDGNEVICDDHAVLAFLLGTLGDEGLFDNFHVGCFLDTAR